MELDNLRKRLESLVSTKPATVMQLEAQRDDAVQLASEAIETLEALQVFLASDDLFRFALQLEKDSFDSKYSHG